VVIPLATQHYMLLQRNLIYTGITRGKRLLVLIGQKKALGIAVRNDRPQRRYSGLLASLKGKKGKASAVESKTASQSRVVS
jgi:exodeoxyribonuclease V alpha subunit